jgi:HTH-like domain
MARAISPGAGRRYGVTRVCQVWDLPRSSFYAARRPRADTTAPAAPARRRGPKPAVSDEALLAAIRSDLTRSPWTGEGHRKVWARLRVIDGIRVARKRVLRIMGEHSLLSPHRARTRTDEPHDRKIITTAPNMMWATDATQIATVHDGKVWLFGVIEHCWGGRPNGIGCANIGSITEPMEGPPGWSINGSRSTRPSMFSRSMGSTSRNVWSCSTSSGDPTSNPSLPSLRRQKSSSRRVVDRTIGGGC